MDTPDTPRTDDDGTARCDRYLAEVAAHLGEVLWLVPADLQRILYVSPACERVWGRPAVDLCTDPRTWHASIYPDDLPGLARWLRGEDGAQALDVEYRVVHPSGAFRWVRSRAFPVRDAAGRVCRYAGISEDVSEQKRVEQELEQARCDALGAMRVKSEFVANMSHEVRTPVNGIVGMAELLRTTSLSPEQREYTETILGCAERLLALIDDMLDFSSVEAGRLELETSPFRLRELLAGAAGVVGHTATTKGIGLTWSVDGDVPDALEGDPNRLRQVLLNLLSNAVKFTAGGKVSVRVARESDAATEVVLRFTVADTGIGIPLDKQGTIFDPFVQGDGTTTRRHGGTGLGLAICARLAQLMGGRIWVASEVGKGSIFYCTARVGVAARERPALDRRQLVEQIGEDPEILLQLVAVFRDESRMLLEEISRALAARDAQRVERAAHRLRGSLGALAALPAQDVALELEMLGRTGNLGPAPERYVALDREMARLEPELVALTADTNAAG